VKDTPFLIVKGTTEDDIQIGLAPDGEIGIAVTGARRVTENTLSMYCGLRPQEARELAGLLVKLANQSEGINDAL
jgi:hypothetical protein